MSNQENGFGNTDKTNQPDGQDIHISTDEKTADGDGKYVTDLDFISTWDTIFYEPSDVYVQSAESIFDGGAFDVGENYPRGV